MSTVLLVEDDRQLMGLLSQLFRVAGYAVLEASSKMEARDYIADADVAVIDFGLPNGDGAELLRDFPDLVTVTISGDARRACDLHKPFVPRDLVELVTARLTKEEP